jgi:hypothetical protein
MRSRRSTFELACRLAAFALLGWLVGGSLIPATGHRLERASTDAIASRLLAWTRAPAGVLLRADLPTTPDVWVVEWLAALAHSGHAVTWSGSPPAVAMSSEALADPSGSVRIDVAAPPRTTVVIRDSASVVDSVRVNQLGATIVTPLAVGTLVGDAGGQRFSAPSPDSTRVRAIVVIGNASWEGKFIVAALEERGWPVIARFHVAPNVDVVQGVELPLDTSRVAAVVAIDTTVQSIGAALERFVRSGGGLVLAGAAALAPATAPLAPGSLGARTRPPILPTDTIGLGTTGFYPVAALTADGVVLDRRSGGIAVAARRVGAGRVMQVGYDDSWRWRMTGAAGSEIAYRDWWSRAVAAVAYLPGAAPTVANVAMASAPLASAPLAGLIARLGPARPTAVDRSPGAAVDRRLLLALIMILLLSEWGSRRMRGLR